MITQPLTPLNIAFFAGTDISRIWRIVALMTLCLLCVLPGRVPNTIAADDSYIAGYVAAVLRHEFYADNLLVSVLNGVVTVDTESLSTLDRTKVQTALERIPGVIRVEIAERPDTAGSPKTLSPEAVTLEVPQLESKFLPRGLLVDPFHADPRWPHFSAAFRHVSFGTEPEATGSANLGETFALYRSSAPLEGQWELSIQAGVFSVFDMRGISTDLQNADYTAGLLASYRTGPFSGFLRLSHQSSHLGDEFIIFSPTPVDRVNLSFEEVDLKLSYELSSWFRVYGGGGILVSRDPKTLGIGTSQFGAELTSPWIWLNGKIRPVAYGDFQVNERSNWAVSRSLMAGLQFENARIGDRRLQVLVEYFKGPSPNGQFFTQSIEWIGLGLHLYY